MKILSNTGGLAHTNCFLIADETTGQCVLFDAPDHTTAPLIDAVRENKWDLVGLWLTHGHFDHVADHEIIRGAFPGVQILIHPLDEPKLQQPNSRFFPLPFKIPPGRADALVEDGQLLTFGNLSCRVIHTPGHAPGHVMYHFEEQKILVGGDLIIGGAIGRYDLPDSDVGDLHRSVRRVMKLPPETTLLPGHGDVSTLADEAASNAYVRQILASAE
jgi:hydroxyacylglutathione hydrolase